jgi:hypothetical protein
MRRRLILLVMAALPLLSETALAVSPITPDGRQLIKLLDSMDVESHWSAGVHVHWESGEPDGKPASLTGKHTHCSAFVASAAKRVGVYILRPPEHGQELLANAQYDWLTDEGTQHGWRPAGNGAEAQALANRGDFVVATYHNHHDDKPGHIAVIRPSTKSEAEIASEGPQVTQAGGTNYNSASLKRGFAGHPAAWTKGEVRYYVHPVRWADSPQASR